MEADLGRGSVARGGDWAGSEDGSTALSSGTSSARTQFANLAHQTSTPFGF
jgi:hypothetical protein